MAIDSLTVWQNGWANLPKVNDDSWKQNLGDYVEARTANMSLATYTPSTNVTFSFNKSLFVQTLDGVSGANLVPILSDAFELAIIGSPIAVSPGTYIGVSTPATTFSVVSSSLFDLASAALGAAKILELASAPKVSDPLLSDFPIKLRDAFLLLTATVSGTNSVVPTPGPLVDPVRSVI